MRDDDYVSVPPFDAFEEFYVDPARARELARRVDSSVREPLGGVVDEEVLEDLDAYYRDVWEKHHGW